MIAEKYCSNDQQDAHLAVVALIHDLLPDDLDEAGLDAYVRGLRDLEAIACPECRAANGLYLSTSGMLLTVNTPDPSSVALPEGKE